MGSFETITEGLFIQDFMECVFPNRKFDLHLKRDGFVRLREGGLPVNSDPYARWEMINLVKGGEFNDGRRNKVLFPDQGGRPGELSQGLSQ